MLNTISINLSRDDFPTLIGRTSPFLILGVFGCISIFFQIEINLLYANSEDPDYAASDLILHYLPVSHKRMIGLNGLKKLGFNIINMH